MAGLRGWRLPTALAVVLLALVGGLHGAAIMTGNGAQPVYGHPPPIEVALPSPLAAGPVQRGEPSVSIVLVGLGLAEVSTRAAIELPAAVGLAFSPYGAEGGDWQRQARLAGHEVWLELPLEPDDAERTDAGPNALRVGGEPSDNIAALGWVLGSAHQPMGLVAAPGRFASQPEALAPVARLLAERRLGLIELGGGRLAAVAAAAGTAHAEAAGPLDRDLAPEAIDTALQGLEATARRTGVALAFARPYPVTLARLAAWAERLGASGLTLAPPSRALPANTSRGTASE